MAGSESLERGSSTDPPSSDRGVKGSDGVPTSLDGRRIAVTPLDAPSVSYRGASPSGAARRRPALRRSGALRYEFDAPLAHSGPTSRNLAMALAFLFAPSRAADF
jgi:hypothetical protein